MDTGSVDVASVSAVVSSLATAGTVLWKGGAIVQTVKQLVAHVAIMNGSMEKIKEKQSERDRQLGRCQGVQDHCPHSQPEGR